MRSIRINCCLEHCTSRVSSVGEHLPSTHQALGSTASTENKIKAQASSISVQPCCCSCLFTVFCFEEEIGSGWGQFCFIYLWVLCVQKCLYCIGQDNETRLSPLSTRVVPIAGSCACYLVTVIVVQLFRPCSSTEPLLTFSEPSPYSCVQVLLWLDLPGRPCHES